MDEIPVSPSFLGRDASRDARPVSGLKEADPAGLPRERPTGGTATSTAFP